MLANHTVTGGGGVRLHVVETGNPRGHPILFLHGLSQCWLTWSRQLHSDLADEYRLVAMDMRGHGLSERPLDGYAESKRWADDLHATIETLHLDHPVLVGWSYGPLVILDYIRHYGEDAIGGVDFVGGVTKLGSDEAMSVLTPEFLSLVPGLFSTDAEESVRALRALIYLCLAHAPSDDELYQMLGFSVSVPPYVRQALLSRAFDNDDLLPRIRKPVLITQGAGDRVVKRAAIDQHQRGMRHAQVHVVPNTGHAPFWDDAAAFNQRLRAFCASI